MAETMGTPSGPEPDDLYDYLSLALITLVMGGAVFSSALAIGDYLTWLLRV